MYLFQILPVLLCASAVLGVPSVSVERSPLIASNVLGRADSSIHSTFPRTVNSSWVKPRLSAFDPSKIPNTGRTVKYDFTIARGVASPDGYQKHVIYVNGQFPGPTIEANWGDWIQVTLHNNITGPEEGTSMHWHGFLQQETPWFDGVPSVTQCPIAPQGTFTYKFRADSFGTSWYHSHYSAQYADGAQGAIIIHGPSQLPYDIDLGPILLTDWYHTPYAKLIEDITGLDQSLWGPWSQGNLVNGIGSYNCSLVKDGTPCTEVPYAKFKFTAGKTHRLRLLNTGAEGFELFSIDGHILTVIANDFVPVVPYNTTVVTLGIGQRTDVLVHAIGKPTDSYWIRANMSAICSRTDFPNVPAAVYYEDADTTQDPETEAWPYFDTGRCNNDDISLTVPYFPIKPPATVSVTETLIISKSINASGNQEWQVNGRAFRGNFDHPILLLAHEKNYSYPGNPEWNVYNFGSNNSVRLVINDHSPDPTRDDPSLSPIGNVLSHPLHLHGHNFWVVAEGEGRWDNSTIINPHNPLRRDTVVLRRGGYVVIEWMQDNPGIWPFHCHIAWHVSEGLYINIMEQPRKIKSMQIPKVMSQTCDAWTYWGKHNVVNQLDSGLRMRD